MQLFKTLSRRPFVREATIFLVFAALTVLATWPYAYYIRDAVTDTGDPYLNAWLLWWNFHQTFQDPLHLFQAPLFYPYEYTLAFTEHNYGLALPFFPLQTLGLRPLTIHGIATLFGFAFSGYGAFRLTRTVTDSTLAAWVAGVAFAFAPYRFFQMPHLTYLSAAWIPLTLEALILYARERTWKRAAWVGLAFLMNGLSTVHWLILTIIPFGVSVALVATRYRLWRERDFWLRAGLTVGIAALILLPFMLPYRRVAQMYNMVRQPQEAAFYSGQLVDWVRPDWRNKLLGGVFFSPEVPGERALYPGLVTVLLAFCGIFLKRRSKSSVGPPPETPTPPRKLLLGLDLLALFLLSLAALAIFYGPFRWELFGARLLRVSHPGRSLLFFAGTVLLRFLLAYPRRLRPAGDANLRATLRRWLTRKEADGGRAEAWEHGLTWLILGFFGSLGMNFFFHRLLFEYVFVFRSIRVPARWAMMACLGLALLAGLGVKHLAARWQNHWPAAALGVALCALLMFESRIAPLEMERGEADPDAVTLFLRDTAMRGGVAHLPVAQGLSNHRYTLRQADHQKPLITAFSGFAPPLEVEIEDLWQQTPVPERLLDILESAPASYLVIHWYTLPPARSEPLRAWVERSIAAGRLRLARSFPVGVSSEDIYAVTKTEP
jgi:hypothetical protein